MAKTTQNKYQRYTRFVIYKFPKTISEAEAISTEKSNLIASLQKEFKTIEQLKVLHNFIKKREQPFLQEIRKGLYQVDKTLTKKEDEIVNGIKRINRLVKD